MSIARNLRCAGDKGVKPAFLVHNIGSGLGQAIFFDGHEEQEKKGLCVKKRGGDPLRLNSCLAEHRQFLLPKTLQKFTAIGVP